MSAAHRRRDRTDRPPLGLAPTAHAVSVGSVVPGSLAARVVSVGSPGSFGSVVPGILAAHAVSVSSLGPGALAGRVALTNRVALNVPGTLADRVPLPDRVDLIVPGTLSDRVDRRAGPRPADRHVVTQDGGPRRDGRTEHPGLRGKDRQGLVDGVR
ncbi:hypothetical protein [Streptomyces sp. SYSU K217416]